MPADWAETHTRRRHTRGVRGIIEGTVAGAATTDEAIAACPHKKGSSFPGDSTIRMLTDPEVSRDRIGLRDVVCTFELPVTDTGGGTPPGGPNPDPLQEPPRILWGRQTIIQPSDVDGEGRSIRNAAGDLYEPKLPRTIISRTFTITKNMPVYPLPLADSHEETVNSDPVQVVAPGGSLTFEPHSLKCLSLTPAGEYFANAEFVPVAVTIERRIAKNAQGQAIFPFREAAVNRGRYGFYSPGQGQTAKRGPITDADGNELTEDVLLDDTGKPIDTTLKVKGSGQLNTPVANPQAVTGYTPLPGAPGPARIHLWQMYTVSNFTSLFRQLGL